MNETWKDIDGFKGYAVSNYGRIKSARKILKPQKTHHNYLQVCLSYGNGRKLARLVAIAFIPNPNNYPEVNHLDGDKANNHISNLEWCTHKENCIHAIRTGLKVNAKGESHYKARLTEKQVLEIRGQVKLGAKQNAIAKQFGLTCGHVNQIVKKKCWKHI